MSDETTDPVGRRRGRRRAGVGVKPRRRTSVVGVLGEVLITAGVLVLLFVGWQQWFNDIVVSNQTSGDASKLSQQFLARPAPAVPSGASSATPPVTAAAKDTQQFGVMYVPRFGSDYKVPIAGGVSTVGTLNKGEVGHYPSTQMPGAVGNFAVAAHRTTHGAPFADIATLHVGDHIYVQTAAGWYTYTFRNLEYVKPTQVQVLQEVPDAPVVSTTSSDRLITMTSCNPKYSAAERIVAFGVLTSWQPLSDVPTELATTVKAG